VSQEIVTVIEARPPRFSEQMKAIWEYRYFYRVLLGEIGMRKYKGTHLGFWWLVLRPLIPAAISIILFTFVVPMETHGEPYPIFFLSSYACWNVFQATVIILPRGLMWSSSMMRRTYFPKLLVPLASVGPPLMEGLVIVSLLVLMTLWFWFRTGHFHLQFGPQILLFPVCVFFTLLLGLAVGMVLSVVSAFARDVVYMATYFVQIFMLMTPVLYPVKFVPEHLRWLLYTLNPMASIVETARWSLTGYGVPPLQYLAVSFPVIIVLFLLGTLFFIRAEPYITDQV
jgi:lipopolysaccharide transport system permease protein